MMKYLLIWHTITETHSNSVCVILTYSCMICWNESYSRTKNVNGESQAVIYNPLQKKSVHWNQTNLKTLCSFSYLISYCGWHIEFAVDQLDHLKISYRSPYHFWLKTFRSCLWSRDHIAICWKKRFFDHHSIERKKFIANWLTHKSKYRYNCCRSRSCGLYDNSDWCWNWVNLLY